MISLISIVVEIYAVLCHFIHVYSKRNLQDPILIPTSYEKENQEW